MKRLLGLERLAWGLGLVLVLAYGAVRVHGAIMKQSDLDRFALAQQAARQGMVAAIPAPESVDFSLWSAERIEAYERSLQRESEAPLAILRIPKIDLEVPVLPGTDDFTLNRAVGHITGTSQPGESGNIGIAGHRDGFFRGLEKMARGDVIELLTLRGTETYVIDRLTIVKPDAVEVLSPTDRPAITLVTCYPFYFVGSAPQRYVVRAVRATFPATAGA